MNCFSKPNPDTIAQFLTDSGNADKLKQSNLSLQAVNKLKDHYEKLIFLIVICMLGGLALALIFDDENLVSKGAYFEESLPYELDNSDGKGKLSFLQNTALCRGKLYLSWRRMVV